ncbi:hypothetical protein [Ornithinibacillus sp. FSL M8-0202]|uniref:hypothetical protein n=1 Tax=Ornithinibacillus sp. FSL M8-0202 TaxID=2921616 RepID=UPI0030D08D34
MEKTNKILIGILICLILLVLKNNSETSYTPSFPSQVDVNTGESVVQLGDNKIAIVNTEYYTENYGEILVLEFNEDKRTFEFISNYNYFEEIIIKE